MINLKRITELMDEDKLSALLVEIEAIKDRVTISGGWAWHFMSPVGHVEYKHAHDHKDIDCFVSPAPGNVASLIMLLRSRGFERTWTRFDSSSDDFYRYTKPVEMGDKVVKVVLDVFIGDIPSVMANGVRITEPNYLISLYGVKHQTEKCFSVSIAKGLIAKGENPVENPAMGDYESVITSLQG